MTFVAVATVDVAIVAIVAVVIVAVAIVAVAIVAVAIVAVAWFFVATLRDAVRMEEAFVTTIQLITRIFYWVFTPGSYPFYRPCLMLLGFSIISAPQTIRRKYCHVSPSESCIWSLSGPTLSSFTLF